ncbi:MAG TPA: hypothetical protein VFP09_02210 [Desertimonas sp.]|nr:hypothetical protein [Desertimonas sp.]
MEGLEVRDWVSFEDPDEQRTWVFDATFLRSSYHCIFGAGCQGVLDADAAEMEQGCCSYGAHFVDEDDVANVVKHFVRLDSRHMQFYDEAVAAGFLTPGEDTSEGEPTTMTRLVDDACIFLNRPGSQQGAGCALHVAALEAGERPLDWKPNVCWQVPLRLEHSTDENGHVTSRLRDWKRRDWGDGGHQFHWWCTESPEAFSGDKPVYVSVRDEIIELIGAPIYDLLVASLEDKRPPALPTPVGLRRRRHSSSSASSSNSTP